MSSYLWYMNSHVIEWFHFQHRTDFDLTTIRIIHHSTTTITRIVYIILGKQIEKLNFWQVHHFITYANTNGILTASFLSKRKLFTKYLGCSLSLSLSLCVPSLLKRMSKEKKRWSYNLNYSEFKNISRCYWFYLAILRSCKQTFCSIISSDPTNKQNV